MGDQGGPPAAPHNNTRNNNTMKAFKIIIVAAILILSAYGLVEAVFIHFTLGIAISVMGMLIGAWILAQEG